MITFDHIAIAGETLAAAQAHVEEALGVALQPGGTHDVFSTHNALLGLEDGLYLEAIAVNPEAPASARPRWFDLDRFSGPARLTNWICRTEDLDKALAQVPEDLGVPVDLQRGALRWRMGVPQSGILPYDNCAPALIEWQTETHPSDVLKASGIRLRRLVVRHPEVPALHAALSGLLSDDRIRFETGPSSLQSEFATPHGVRVIEG